MEKTGNSQKSNELFVSKQFNTYYVSVTFFTPMPLQTS